MGELKHWKQFEEHFKTVISKIVHPMISSLGSKRTNEILWF